MMGTEIDSSWENTRLKEENETLRTNLTAAQCRIELLERDMKSGDYESLYAQVVEELRVANKKLENVLNTHKPGPITTATQFTFPTEHIYTTLEIQLATQLFSALGKLAIIFNSSSEAITSISRQINYVKDPS